MDNEACICFNDDAEIVINDFDKDADKWLSNYVAPKMGRSVNSLIYLPIRAKAKKVGVITVQSFNTNCYTEYDVNVLQSI